MTKYFSDFVKLSDGIVKYTEDNVYGLPMFVINGMKLSNSSDFVIPTNKSYILDIRDGKFAWENAVESHPEFIYLNFYYDNKSEQNVEMNFVFIEDRIKTDNTILAMREKLIKERTDNTHSKEKCVSPVSNINNRRYNNEHNTKFNKQNINLCSKIVMHINKRTKTRQFLVNFFENYLFLAYFNSSFRTVFNSSAILS